MIGTKTHTYHPNLAPDHRRGRRPHSKQPRAIRPAKRLPQRLLPPNNLIPAADVDVVVLREVLRAGAADTGHDGFGFFVGVDGAGGFEVVLDRGEGGEGCFCGRQRGQ